MSESSSQQLVVFSLGSEEYALPIAAVHEIIRFTEPRSASSQQIAASASGLSQTADSLRGLVARFRLEA